MYSKYIHKYICTAGSQEDTPVVSLMNFCGNTPCNWLPLEALYSATVSKSVHSRSGYNNYSAIIVVIQSH